jgi:hypothetical protein
VQRRHNCSQAASSANCAMTLYLLKVHLQTFLSIPVTQKCQNFELWHSCCKWAIFYRSTDDTTGNAYIITLQIPNYIHVYQRTAQLHKPQVTVFC